MIHDAQMVDLRFKNMADESLDLPDAYVSRLFVRCTDNSMSVKNLVMPYRIGFVYFEGMKFSSMVLVPFGIRMMFKNCSGGRLDVTSCATFNAEGKLTFDEIFVDNAVITAGDIDVKTIEVKDSVFHVDSLAIRAAGAATITGTHGTFKLINNSAAVALGTFDRSSLFISEYVHAVDAISTKGAAISVQLVSA